MSASPRAHRSGNPSLLAEPPVAHVPRQVVGFQVDAPGRERLRAVVGQTDRLVVGQQRELARREHGLPLLPERLARADRAAAPSGSPGQERELGPARGLGERVGGLCLQDAPAHLGRDPGRRLVAQGQEDPGAERLEERAPGLASGEHRAERGDRLRGDDRDAAALPGERERLLVASGIVLADGRERLVLLLRTVHLGSRKSHKTSEVVVGDLLILYCHLTKAAIFQDLKGDPQGDRKRVTR